MENSRHKDSHIEIQRLTHDYLDELRVMRYSEKSLDVYSRAINDFIKHVKKNDPRDITGKDLEKYRALLLEREFKPASVVSYFKAVKLFFKYLEENQRIFVNPASCLPPMKTAKELQPVPTESEMQILLNGPDLTTPVGIRDKAMLETVYSTGVRRNELITMTVSCLHLEDGKARIMGKGQRERMVPLGVEAVRSIWVYLRQVRDVVAREYSGDALWLGIDGRALGCTGLGSMVKRYATMPGITTMIGLHSIRRACATHMLRHGAPAAAIQLLLGHADMSHLSQYLKVTINDLRNAHEHSRLGA